MYGGDSIDDGGARQMEIDRAARVEQGKGAIGKTFDQFDDEYYAGRATDFTKFAAPQFTDQLTKTRNSLAASLARRGLSSSSAAVRAEGDLNKYAAGKQREIADQATGAANRAREDVEDQRAEVTNQLLASGDPMAASAGALSSANRLKTPSAFQSLGNLFADWSETWRQNEAARSVDPSVPPLFSFGRPRKNAMSVVN